MIHLALRTEHSYGFAAGRLDPILKQIHAPRAGIADRSGTWGHVPWAKACRAAGTVPVFGVELAFVKDMEAREKQVPSWMTLLARNEAGLRRINELTTLATEKFYFIPRLEFSLLKEIPQDIIVLSGSSPDWSQIPKKLRNFYVSLAPTSAANTPERACGLGYKLVASVDNLYPTPDDRSLYEMIAGDGRTSSTSSRHILENWEWESLWPDQVQSFDLAEKLAEGCNVSLPAAELVHPDVKKTLRQFCTDGAKRLGLNVKSGPYAEQLERELKVIAEKQFEDYFFVVADMIQWAKKRMLVGPARGSSCGSLVCYLLGITDIDPLRWGLLFERFIDLNRRDLPDIDIDFQDDRRELVFEYLRGKYGHAQVARLGTVSVFKPKSAINVVAKNLQIPTWEVKDLTDAIIERSTGDARAAFCIADTFAELEVGRRTLEKYPELGLSAKLEGHAHNTGMHAAGILITAKPVTNYCSINEYTGTAMIDKYSAEGLGLLKIDALGLRTLSIVQDVLDQVGTTYEKFREIPLDDSRAFAILNDSRFTGIFQFEGNALQSLSKNMRVENIEDVISLTALARPGPFESGGANEFIKRRTGASKVSYLHPLCEACTRITHGIIVYQEQVMQIAREVGALSWEEVSTLRRAMSKSLGKEYFNQFWEIFWKGAGAKGLTEVEAKKIWDSINTMGSWAFNRSHAVAYGLVSYWCMWLKAHHPLEFAAAVLRNAKDDDQSVKVLRELTLEGYKYKPFDPKLSLKNWSVQEGILVGGLTAIKGVGDKLADTLLRKRESGTAYTAREDRLLREGVTPWDEVFECATRWAHIFREPARYGIASALCTVDTIKQESSGTFVFIAKLVEKNQRDHNEAKLIERRKGSRMSGQTLYLNLVLEDDTGSIPANINRYDYQQYGMPIIEEGKVGDWYLWRGQNRPGFRRVNVERWKKLSGNEEFACQAEKVQKVVSKSTSRSEHDVVKRKPAKRKTKTTKHK